MPAFAAELALKLTKIGEVGLAESLLALSVVEICPCGGDFCAGFYTEPKPGTSYGPGLGLCKFPASPILITDVCMTTYALQRFWSETASGEIYLKHLPSHPRH